MSVIESLEETWLGVQILAINGTRVDPTVFGCNLCVSV